MSNSNSSSSGGGIGLFGAVFVAFLVLKLTEVITWSWWWVTAPLWGGFALVAVIGLPILAYYILKWAWPVIIGALITVSRKLGVK